MRVSYKEWYIKTYGAAAWYNYSEETPMEEPMDEPIACRAVVADEAFNTAFWDKPVFLYGVAKGDKVQALGRTGVVVDRIKEEGEYYGCFIIDFDDEMRAIVSPWEVEVV